MQVEEQQLQEKLNAITHSPYYGCTVRVVSKARVSYEGVLDGISANKDRIFLKNVRVNANLILSPNRENSYDDINTNSTSDTLNAVMIDHLTNDIRRYEQVCLNVGDIQELRLIQLPSTFHESKTKLRAIDPCLVDIRLSPSDEYETRSNGSGNDQPMRAPIARQKRGESFGSNGGSALISSSSNESSSSFGLRASEKFADESNDESLDEQIEKFRQLTTTTPTHSKPVTLLAKKILPKKIERRTEAPLASSINTQTPHIRPTITNQREPVYGPTRVSPQDTTMKKVLMVNNANRKSSPLRVTITSKLNPNATPFFTQQRNVPTIQNPSITFYDRSHFRARLPPVISPDRSQSLPYGMNVMNNQQQQQQSPQNYPQYHQRFIPPRQMANKRNMIQTNPSRTNTRSTRAPPPPIMKYRLHPSTSSDKRIYPQQQQQQQQQQKEKPTLPNDQFSGFMRQTSLPTVNQIMHTPPIQGGFSLGRNNPARQSTASIHSTISLPFPYGSPNDCNQIQKTISFGDSVGSHRGQRTFSGGSSCSSLSLDIGPHSIVQLDSSSGILTSFEEQYDFEKANEEFRRYLELEELVARHPSTPDNNSVQEQQSSSQANSYKKEISFFDRISCTATTGTAVGYTEMDETEKNLETFGNDALLVSSNSNDDEWQL